MSLGRKLGAEFFGTFWLTFGGCGSNWLTTPRTIKDANNPNRGQDIVESLKRIK